METEEFSGVGSITLLTPGDGMIREKNSDRLIHFSASSCDQLKPKVDLRQVFSLREEIRFTARSDILPEGKVQYHALNVRKDPKPVDFCLPRMLYVPPLFYPGGSMFPPPRAPTYTPYVTWSSGDGSYEAPQYTETKVEVECRDTTAEELEEELEEEVGEEEDDDDDETLSPSLPATMEEMEGLEGLRWTEFSARYCCVANSEILQKVFEDYKAVEAAMNHN